MKSPLVVVSFFVVLAGCLPDDPDVDGRLLYPGITIESPVFADPSVLDGEPWVFFNIRTRRKEGDIAGVYDLHRVHWDDGRALLVVGGVSERPEWSSHETDATGASFYMLDERLPGGGRSVGTLARVTLADGVVETLEDVIGYQLHASRQRYLYRKYVPDSPWAELHLRDLAGDDRNLGALSGSVQYASVARMYWVSGEDHTLMRLTSWDGEPQPLRSNVSGFDLQFQEKVAIVTVSEKSQVRKFVLNLETLKERPLPVDNPCCWLGLRGNTAVFSESATATSPGKLHTYDILTEKHDVVVLPEGLADIRSIVQRHPFTDSLVTDSNGQLAMMRPGNPTTFELVSLHQPKATRFTSDGKHLIYIQEEAPPPPPAVSSSESGRLMAQDAEDWEAAPRLLSPPGASVRITPSPGYLLPTERPRQVIFWAQYGLGASDLYLTDLDTRQTLKLAVGIGAVAIGGRYVLGVVRITQDLTGDLVHRDFLTGDEQLIEHSVAAATTRDQHPVHGAIVAFVVRERRPSSKRNGLWAAPLKLLPPTEEREKTLQVPDTFIDGAAESWSRSVRLEASR
jgi:hypothetical protein